MAKSKKVVPVQERLTDVQKFFIKGNMEVLSPEDIAEKLDITVADVDEFIKVSRPVYEESRLSDNLSRPAQRGGVVAMTEAASTIADDGYHGIITQAEINRAAYAGDHALAAELQKQRESQMKDAKQAEAARYGDRWHYIKKV